MRIAVIGPDRHPVRTPFAGGLESLVWHSVAGLLRRGHHVELFALPGSDFGSCRQPLVPVDWEPREREVAGLAMSARDFVTEQGSYLAVVEHLRERAGDFDIVQNHSLSHVPVALASLLPAPVFTTVHTPPYWLMDSALALAGGAVRLGAVSAGTAAQWRASQPVTVLHNGVDETRWTLGPGGEDWAWVGRIAPEKAPHLAIEAARRAGVPLVLAGPVSDPAYHRASVLPLLSDSVRHVGHLGPHQLDALLGASRGLLVTPVWPEPFGLVAVEALLTGTPVIAFDRGGLGEILADQPGATLVPTGGDLALALRAHRDPSDRAQVRAAAVARFGLDRMLDRYEQWWTEQV